MSSPPRCVIQFTFVVYILFAWLQLKAVEEHYAKYYDK